MRRCTTDATVDADHRFTLPVADIAEVLAREPRHFGALSGLGMILQEIGDDKHALEAYRKALAVDPHLDNVPDVVKTLTEKVEGNRMMEKLKIADGISVNLVWQRAQGNQSL